jgi:hypothetical protein
MPSDLSFWLISVPRPDGDTTAVLADVRKTTGGTVPVGGWELPDLKVSRVLSRRKAHMLKGAGGGYKCTSIGKRQVPSAVPDTPPH